MARRSDRSVLVTSEETADSDFYSSQDTQNGHEKSYKGSSKTTDIDTASLSIPQVQDNDDDGDDDDGESWSHRDRRSRSHASSWYRTSMDGTGDFSATDTPSLEEYAQFIGLGEHMSGMLSIALSLVRTFNVLRSWLPNHKQKKKTSSVIPTPFLISLHEFIVFVGSKHKKGSKWEEKKI
jgi:hypothetical protein